MLGRLKMSVEECIEAYKELSEKVFQKRKIIQAKFSSRALANMTETLVKKIIRDRDEDEDALLKDRPDSKCKVYV